MAGCLRGLTLVNRYRTLNNSTECVVVLSNTCLSHRCLLTLQIALPAVCGAGKASAVGNFANFALPPNQEVFGFNLQKLAQNIAT